MAMFEIHTVDEQINALPTVDTASGSIATFDTDMTENLVEVKCQIVARQGGSGTPSPDNQRPIQTYTEMDLSICGKNLLNTSIIMPNIRSERQVLQNYPMKQGTYCFSFKGKNSGSIVGYFNIESQYEPNVRVDIPVDADDRFSGTITLTRDQNIGILCNGAAVGYNYKISDIQIERGSQPTEFVENGTTKRVFFDQTVAGGVLDITTGKLRVTHGYSLLSNLNWNAVGDRFYADPSNILKADGITTNSSHYAPIANIAGGGVPMSDLSICAINRGTTDRLYIKDNRFSDVNTFVLTMGNVQIIYELETPLTIQLDSITLQALLNENNIWCDTGSTEVKYLLTVGRAS